ncbi:ATP synthase F0 subunit C [Streptococcus oralis subsp. tigurinus]|uniref:ATP synthase F0 subunit C n=1 Tax=Streptococcus oralis subsp. tigurinus TaxID=1077464 RepID=A0A1X0X1G6_STROR|nr:hypothetical protein [Streptococcus oralis]ORJ32858.1 ATP synthase F0 subunit C [Streptococcus oralis subsp. tigurinus]
MESSQQISQLTIKSLSEKHSAEAVQAASFEALYTVTEMELQEVYKILKSDEELFAKFEEAKGKMTNGNQ